MRKPACCICENKDADQLISAFVFTTRVVQSLYSLNPKFQASSHLLKLYSPVCVGPGRKPRRPDFSQRGSFMVKREKKKPYVLGVIERKKSDEKGKKKKEQSDQRLR